MRVLAWLGACCAALAQAAEPLPALRAEAGPFTVSGVSSGGYMAVQVHVAHSARVKGVGALGAGPYYCAQGSFAAAYYNCTTPGAWSPLPSLALLQQAARAAANSATIDPVAHLAGARVWLFSGRNDRTVHPEVVSALARFYEAFKAQPVLVADKPAGHGMVTDDAGVTCERTEAPYLNDCDYDAAGALLAHLLGPLNPRGAADGRLLAFDQSRFGGASIGMAASAYVYIPRDCEAGGCRVHVAFHGCRQNAEAVGERFVRQAGYNRWAETNRLLVLYPQTTARWFNSRACWDWWGYTGPLYHTQQAPQIRAVLAMVERLSAGK